MHFTLADLVTDIAQNSAEAGASFLEVEIAQNAGEFCFKVADDGCGMDAGELERAFDPFVTGGKHPERKVGLGLPFLIQTAEQTGGFWDVKSRKGAGVAAYGRFDTGHWDAPPAGDIPLALTALMMLSPPDDIRIVWKIKNHAGRETHSEFRRSRMGKGGKKFEEDAGALAAFCRRLRALESAQRSGAFN